MIHLAIHYQARNDYAGSGGGILCCKGAQNYTMEEVDSSVKESPVTLVTGLQYAIRNNYSRFILKTTDLPLVLIIIQVGAFMPRIVVHICKTVSNLNSNVFTLITLILRFIIYNQFVDSTTKILYQIKH